MNDGELGAALRRAYQVLLAEVADQPALRGYLSTEDAWMEWEERAAIREYDGGMGRGEAEALTALELGKARPLGRWTNLPRHDRRAPP